MDPEARRRDFLKASAGAVAARAVAAESTVRIGMVGLGRRGPSLLSSLVTIKGIEVPALCDIDETRVANAQRILAKAGRAAAEPYSSSEDAYLKLVAREDLHAVIIAAPWHWHTRMAVAAMKARKYAAVEVPAALSVAECWDLVNTSEQTGMPCMMLENWSFRRDNLAILNMIRAGLFGEIVHCHCAHSHNCVDHWFFDTDGSPRWGSEFLYRHNRDQYPTHGLGPVLSWMDLNCGDRMETLVSMASRPLGVQNYFAKRFGPNHSAAKKAVKQGDIVSTLIKTAKGNTIVMNYDMQLPRPYDNRWMIQGTQGVYKEQNAPEASVIYLAGHTDRWPSPEGPDYEQWKPFPPFQERHDHAWWRGIEEAGGHGGTDTLELARFVDAVRNKTQTPIDVYDSATFSCVIPLTEQSIAGGSTPVECPDFTRGKWKTRSPRFAV